MKKLLAIGLSLSIVASSATLAVSCGPGNTKNVQLWLLQESASATSKINSAYAQLVKDYNKQAKAAGKLQVDFKWKASGAINKTMITDKAKLPDLYVSYPDAVSYYKVASTTKDLVRDMKKTYGSNYEKDIQNGFVDPVFLTEGTIGEDINVLPYFKSLDFSTINLNLFREVYTILVTGSNDYTADEGKAMTDQINAYNAIRAKRTSNSNEQKNSDLSDIKIFGKIDAQGKVVVTKEQVQDMQDAFGGESAITALKERFDGKKGSEVINEIKAINARHSEILPFIRAINAGLTFNEGVDAIAQAKSDKNGKYAKMTTKTTNQHYAIAIDSLTNKFFMDYASQSGKTVADTTSADSDFIYTVNPNFDKKEATVTLDKESQAYKNTTSFLQELKNIALQNNNATNTDIAAQWDGVFLSGKMDASAKLYVSEYFNSGSTLYSSGSTAGMWAYQSSTNLNRYDILVTSAINAEGNQGYFLSQGPGIAGFNSQGSNAAEKEKTVTDFLNYIYKANVQAASSIQSGYLPSTKDGMSVFEKYHTEKFNVNTGEWNVDLDAETNADLKAEVERLESTYNFKFAPITAVDSNDIIVGKWLTNDMLVDYFGFNNQGVMDPRVMKNNLKYVIGTLNILGDGIRNSFDSALKTGTKTLMNLNDNPGTNFSELFTIGKENYNVSKWIYEKRNDLISDIYVNPKNKK
ncbi:hypothetical protein [Mesoplasma melaleucae]|uniref:sn-glycerol-3-phosphate ABC transporter substrate-binding protein n=1 Tax=Mesoplasma melaleucae TaxID=81459 RepID=A0A2K8NV29_9MOLU|nr:hypothetical protein [Mesoplasma melaleucae]ATZ17624.1 sn-glycerol-3-phosphate ABC transporter substrate-binding protein [Mesoplasma melaleucae]